MLHVIDEDRYVDEMQGTTCDFHKLHPGEAFAGCCCSFRIFRRRVDDEEYAQRRRERLKRERAELESRLRQINAELADVNPPA